MRSSCPDASLLSILRRFVRGDLPTTVWCTEDLSQAPPLGPFLAVGRQLLYDSRGWRDVRRGVAALAPIVGNRGIDLADLNWRRLTALRQALLHARARLPSAAWRGVEARIVHAPGEAALAWLCAGWLRSDRRAMVQTTVETASSRGEGTAGGGEPLLAVSVGDITATLTSHSVEVAGMSAPPMTVSARVETEADAIAAELRSLSRDDALAAAVEVLLDMFRNKD